MTLEYLPQGQVTMSKYVVIRVRNTTAVARGRRSSPAGSRGDAALG